MKVPLRRNSLYSFRRYPSSAGLSSAVTKPRSMTTPSDDRMGGRFGGENILLRSPEARIVQIEHFLEGRGGVVVKPQSGPADAAEL